MHHRYRQIAGHGPGPEPIRRDDHATSVDRDLECALIELLETHFGVVGVVAEERVSDGGGILNPTADLRAYVDPIDGTHLYNRRTPGSTSTVGFEIAGWLCSGIVYSPAGCLLHIARRGDAAVTVALDGVPDAAERETGDVEPTVVAVKSRLRKSVPAVERALVDHGYRVENLGSVANRLVAIAGGRIAGLVKSVHVTHGVPRLWGVAAGLLLCEDAGVPLFWQASNQILAVGDPGIADSLVAEGVCGLAASDLDSLWHTMKARGQV
jgi:fructose-1,6-bisphosphatase/inositol monophosphatase family enzyme